MTPAEVPDTVQNDVYNPDDVSLQDSPPLKPLKPKLQPTPSSLPDDSKAKDAKPVPLQGDVVLVGLLGSGRALEVARRAGTDLLPADDKEKRSKTNFRVDNVANLKVLATDALKAAKFHSTNAIIAPNGPTKPSLREINIAPRPDAHDRNMPLEDRKHHLSPKLFSIRSNKLAPIQEPLPKAEKVNDITLLSISALLGHIANKTTSTISKDSNSTR